MKFFFSFLILTAFHFSGFSQTKPEGKDDNYLKKEFILDDKRYLIYNNWVSFGAGPGGNSNLSHFLQFSIGADYNFHIKKNYFQAGVLLSGDDFGNYNNVQGHLCFIKRKETPKINLSYIGGISYSKGILFQDSAYSKTSFSSPGLYACIQLIAKIKYDVGLGPALFADINFERAIYGLRLDFYFSGAYKGKK